MATSQLGTKKPQVRLWLGLVAIFIIGWIFYWNHLEPWLWEREQRMQPIQLLGEALDDFEMNYALGRVGLRLVLRNGDWLAIRQNHRHGSQRNIPDAFAIALDSDGRWYEAEHDYCTQIRGYRSKFKEIPNHKHSLTARAIT